MDNKKYDVSVLVDGCGQLGITLNERQVEDFITYYEYLIEINKVMNLTGITEFNEVMLKHFVDSLSIVKVMDIEKIDTLIDVGTGAGFPGFPLKIAFPHLKVVLLDSLNKRVRFLNEMTEKLNYNGIECIHGRAEELAKNKKYREKFDLCVSRAVANLASLSEYCLPFVKVGGDFVSYKSADIETEMKNAKKAINILGGRIADKKDFLLPDSDIGRSLVVIHKDKITNMKYPRKAGIPTKEPL